MAQTPPFTATKATGSWGWLPGNRTPVLGSCPLSCSPTSVSPFVMMSPSPPRLLCSVAEQSFSHKERFGLLWLKMRTSVFVLERFHLVIATPVKWASYFGPRYRSSPPHEFPFIQPHHGVCRLWGEGEEEVRKGEHDLDVAP